MTTMQMTKTSRACAVPLRFKYGVKAWTGMSDKPVCSWNQQIQLNVSRKASHSGPAR